MAHNGSWVNRSGSRDVLYNVRQRGGEKSKTAVTQKRDGDGLKRKGKNKSETRTLKIVISYDAHQK